MAQDKVAVAVVARHALGRRKRAHVPIELVCRQLHVDHGVSNAVLVAQRQDPVVEAFHDAPFCDVKLIVRPFASTPSVAVELRMLLWILSELDGNDQGSENNDFGRHRVNVKHLVLLVLV